MSLNKYIQLMFNKEHKKAMISVHFGRMRKRRRKESTLNSSQVPAVKRTYLVMFLKKVYIDFK